MQSYEGGCLCGKLRFRVARAALESGYCHCRMCQKNSGAPVVAWTTFATAGFSWLAGTPGRYQSSARAERLFCADSGTYLVFHNAAPPAEISINTASFDDPSAFPPRMHIYAASRIPWFRTADELPSHQG